ncbi:MAG TPA: hypothetical protein IAC00_04240 [Candidatus Limivicinus faecipullorum]|nr:hypothetical protein [Candidatus Limivicinus faecipullorum]
MVKPFKSNKRITPFGTSYDKQERDIIGEMKLLRKRRRTPPPDGAAAA